MIFFLIQSQIVNFVSPINNKITLNKPIIINQFVLDKLINWRVAIIFIMNCKIKIYQEKRVRKRHRQLDDTFGETSKFFLDIPYEREFLYFCARTKQIFIHKIKFRNVVFVFADDIDRREENWCHCESCGDTELQNVQLLFFCLLMISSQCYYCKFIDFPLCHLSLKAITLHKFSFAALRDDSLIR